MRIIVVLALIGGSVGQLSALQCGPRDFVYGANELADQLIGCAMGRTGDIILTPQADHTKKTSASLIEQGLSSKTSTIYAKLGGLWTGRRASNVETGWLCERENSSSDALTNVLMSTVIELSGVSLEVIEKLDTPLHGPNHYKLAAHKPCKTFELPLALCRQSKPIYRTTRTWINRAYYNLTLTQGQQEARAQIERLSAMFTCPESYKQKITYSPSSMYLLTRFASANKFGSEDGVGKSKRAVDDAMEADDDDESLLTHPANFAQMQDGNGPASPPYHKSVELITRQVHKALLTSLTECLALIDSDLTIAASRRTFGPHKFAVSTHADSSKTIANTSSSSSTMAAQDESSQCANSASLEARIERAANASASLHNDASDTDKTGPQNSSPAKRSGPRQPAALGGVEDPNQLLHPHSHYHGSVSAPATRIDDI